MQSNRIIEKQKVTIYSTLLFNSVLEDGGVEAVIMVRNQLKQIQRHVIDSAELTRALSEKGFTAEERSNVVKLAFSGFNPRVVDMMSVVAQRLDSDKLNQIVKDYEKLIKNVLNVCVADVETCVELDDSLRETIKNKISSELNVQVYLSESINKSILGGVVISVDGKRLDASVFSQLEKARTTLKTTIDGGEC